MKKKVLAALMAAAVLMTACGGAEAPAEETAAEEATEVVEEAQEETAETETEEVAPEEDAEVPEETTGDYLKGVTTEAGYESEWMGIRFTAPEGASLLTEEQLNEMMGLGKEVLSQDFNELQLKYAEMTSVTEMMCTATEGTPNVVITVDKMLMDISIEDYITAFEQTLSQVTTMTYAVESDDEVVSVGGKEFNKISTSADYQGTSMKQDFFIMLQGDRAVAFTLTYTEETADKAAEMLNAFTAY